MDRNGQGGGTNKTTQRAKIYRSSSKRTAGEAVIILSESLREFFMISQKQPDVNLALVFYEELRQVPRMESLQEKVMNGILIGGK